MPSSLPKVKQKKKSVKPLSPKRQMVINQSMTHACLVDLRSGGDLGKGALRAWLIDALERVQKGENANKIFGVGKTQGISSRVSPVLIYTAVEHFSKTQSKTDAIGEVVERVNLSREAVSKTYYEHKQRFDELMNSFKTRLSAQPGLFESMEKVILWEILSKK